MLTSPNDFIYTAARRLTAISTSSIYCLMDAELHKAVPTRSDLRTNWPTSFLRWLRVVWETEGSSGWTLSKILSINLTKTVAMHRLQQGTS